MESSNADVHQLTPCTKTTKSKNKKTAVSVSVIFTKERCVFPFTDGVSANVMITIRGARVEDGGFLLRDLMNFAIQLTG